MFTSVETFSDFGISGLKLKDTFIAPGDTLLSCATQVKAFLPGSWGSESC